VTIKMNSRVGVGQGERVGLHVHDRDGIIRKSHSGRCGAEITSGSDGTVNCTEGGSEISEKI
jgi:hypothetical protein